MVYKGCAAGVRFEQNFHIQLRINVFLDLNVSVNFVLKIYTAKEKIPEGEEGLLSVVYQCASLLVVRNRLIFGQCSQAWKLLPVARSRCDLQPWYYSIFPSTGFDLLPNQFFHLIGKIERNINYHLQVQSSKSKNGVKGKNYHIKAQIFLTLRCSIYWWCPQYL